MPLWKQGLPVCNLCRSLWPQEAQSYVDMSMYGMPTTVTFRRLADLEVSVRKIDVLVTNLVFSRKLLWHKFVQFPGLDHSAFLHHNAALLAFLFRPTDAVVQYKAALKQRLGLQEPYVALHVRRTDKVREEFVYAPQVRRSLLTYLVACTRRVRAPMKTRMRY